MESAASRQVASANWVTPASCWRIIAVSRAPGFAAANAKYSSAAMRNSGNAFAGWLAAMKVRVRLMCPSTSRAIP